MKQNYKLCAQYHVYIWFTEVQNMKGYDKNCIPATLILCAAAILDLELIMTWQTLTSDSNFNEWSF